MQRAHVKRSKRAEVKRRETKARPDVSNNPNTSNNYDNLDNPHNPKSSTVIEGNGERPNSPLLTPVPRTVEMHVFQYISVLLQEVLFNIDEGAVWWLCGR